MAATHCYLCARQTDKSTDRRKQDNMYTNVYTGYQTHDQTKREHKCLFIFQDIKIATRKTKYCSSNKMLSPTHISSIHWYNDTKLKSPFIVTYTVHVHVGGNPKVVIKKTTKY